MKHNRTNITYSAADIQQYLEGKMSPAQMNALEKAALDDPFLYEAIEGYQGVKAEDWQPALQGLRQGFAAPIDTAKVVKMGGKRYGWIKYAAAVLLLGGSITFYLLNKTPDNSNHPNLATVEKNEAAPTSATPQTVQTDSIGTLANNSNVLINSKLDTQRINISTNANATTTFYHSLQRADSTTYAVAEPLPNEKPRAEEALEVQSNAAGLETKDFKFTIPTTPAQTPAKAKVAAPAPSNMADKKFDDVAVASKEYDVNNRNVIARNQNGFYNQQTLNNNKQGLLANNNTVGETNRSFSARVVDANNNPLPFANITVTNERFGTYADAKGDVRLISTDSVLPIEVTSLGYETQNIVLRSGDRPATIQLKEDANLAYEEKTIDRKRSNNNNVISRRAFLQQDVEQNAEPADGWAKYDTYISNNLIIPDDLVKKNVHGEVALSFDVQKNGAITNIKVDKSLCGDCDEIAKRIVAQGPQWKVKKGKKAKARVKVQF